MLAYHPAHQEAGRTLRSPETCICDLQSCLMNPRILVLALIAFSLAACSKANPPNAAPSTTTAGTSAMSAAGTVNDAVQMKLKELAGSGATDCGRHEMQAQAAELTTASSCALDAARNKKAFS